MTPDSLASSAPARSSPPSKRFPSNSVSTPRAIAADVGVSLIVVLLTVSFALSYAALLFRGMPEGVQAQGLFMMLTSVLLLSVIGAVLSTLEVSFLTLEGSSVAAMAAGSVALHAEMQGADPMAMTATLGVGLMLAAFLTGVCLFALGQLRGGAVARFVPLQVMAGVIAASGWSLLMGGAAVMTRTPATLELLSRSELWMQLGIGVGMAVALVVLVPRLRSAFALPGLILSMIAGHHAVCAALRISIAQQRAAGWLTEMPAPPRLPAIWQADTLVRVNWAALSHQTPVLFTIIAVTLICALLNTAGLELASKRDIDLDRDLRANGIAVMMTGLCGGVVGSLSLSRTLLLFRNSSGRRGLVILSGLLATAVPLAFPMLLGVIPRSVLGALLMFVAVGILRTWAVDIRHRLSRVEWFSLLAVLATGIEFGLVAGVFMGLVLGCATFAVIYSLGSPVRARYGGDVAHSNVARPDPDRALLQMQADALLVLYLQGYLFFGTASRLLQSIKRDIASGGGRLRFLVLDGSNIDGLDGSARATLERLMQVADQNGITVTFAALSAANAARLGAIPGLLLSPSLDQALEQAEDALLLDEGGGPPRPFMATLVEELPDPADAAALIQILVRSTVPPGRVMMTQGEASADLVFLESGRASVTVAFGEAPAFRVRTYGAGTMLGEIGFLLGTPRTATVRADVACEIWTLTREGMARLEREQPSVALGLQRAVMRRLSLRLLDKDHLVAALMRGTRR